MAMRSHDATAIPLCRECHHCFHSVSGPFKGFDREMLHDFHAAALERVLMYLVVEAETVARTPSEDTF